MSPEPYVGQAQRARDNLAAARRAMRFTTARGRWVAYRDYTRDERGQIRHSLGDRLGATVYPADAEHAVRYQPAEIERMLTATEQFLDHLDSVESMNEYMPILDVVREFLVDLWTPPQPEERS